MRLVKSTQIVLYLILFAYPMAQSYAESPWPQFMHDARHTGRSEYTIPDKIKILWISNFAIQEITGLSISGDGGTIYAGSVDHNVYAVNAADGSVLWQYLTDHEIVGTPAVDQDGNIYVGSKDDHLHCLNPDGTPKWKFKLLSDAIGSPLIGTVGPLNFVVIATVNRMYTILDGASLWQDPFDLLDGRPYKSWYAGPTFGSDATIYSPGSSNAGAPFQAIDSGGEPKWTLNIGSTGTSTPTVGDNGIIYIPSGIGTGAPALTAVNPNGTEAWSFLLQDMPYLSNPATGPDGTIYIGCNDSYLYAINSDGTLKWRYLMNSSMNGSSFAIDTNGSILTVSQSGNAPLVALDSDGNLKWKVFPGNAFPDQAPVIGKDGVVYIATKKGIVAISNGDQIEIKVGERSDDNVESGVDDGPGGGGGGCFLSTMNQ